MTKKTRLKMESLERRIYMLERVAMKRREELDRIHEGLNKLSDSILTMLRHIFGSTPAITVTPAILDRLMFLETKVFMTKERVKLLEKKVFPVLPPIPGTKKAEKVIPSLKKDEKKTKTVKKSPEGA